jgi:hypothetical protein
VSVFEYEPERGTIIIEEDDSVGNSLTVSSRVSGTDLYVEIDNPWAGDTETGFGRRATFTLSKDDARALIEYLTSYLDADTVPKPPGSGKS